MEFRHAPRLGWNFFTKEKFDMPHLSSHVEQGLTWQFRWVIFFQHVRSDDVWKDAEKLCSQWNGQFALKGIMSVEDAKRAVDIGCTGIMVSNHGGRQLDGSRAPSIISRNL